MMYFSYNEVAVPLFSTFFGGFSRLSRPSNRTLRTKREVDSKQASHTQQDHLQEDEIPLMSSPAGIDSALTLFLPKNGCEQPQKLFQECLSSYSWDSTLSIASTDMLDDEHCAARPLAHNDAHYLFDARNGNPYSSGSNTADETDFRSPSFFNNCGSFSAACSLMDD
ncbi:AaceriACR161Cp [[Ashbya] aceris (nom. inval.)]|nr:AaceriACR161Cp [[Ashbya] aceris (nom. inval.)]